MSFFSTGSGLVLQHFRPNEECGVLEELEPIDSNLNYDFNYQVYCMPGIIRCIIMIYFDIITCSNSTFYQEKCRFFL